MQVVKNSHASCLVFKQKFTPKNVDWNCWADTYGVEGTFDALHTDDSRPVGTEWDIEEEDAPPLKTSRRSRPVNQRVSTECTAVPSQPAAQSQSADHVRSQPSTVNNTPNEQLAYVARGIPPPSHIYHNSQQPPLDVHMLPPQFHAHNVANIQMQHGMMVMDPLAYDGHQMYAPGGYGSMEPPLDGYAVRNHSSSAPATQAYDGGNVDLPGRMPLPWYASMLDNNVAGHSPIEYDSIHQSGLYGRPNSNSGMDMSCGYNAPIDDTRPSSRYALASAFATPLMDRNEHRAHQFETIL